MSANCQADFFGASRSVYLDVIFFGGLLSQAGLSQWSYCLRFPEILNPKEYCTQLLGVAQCFLIPAVLATPQLVQMHMKMKKAEQWLGIGMLFVVYHVVSEFNGWPVVNKLEDSGQVKTISAHKMPKIVC